MWVYGRHAVAAVLSAGKRKSKKLYVTGEKGNLPKGNESLLELCRRQGVSCQVVAPSFLEKKLPPDAVSQGVLLETEEYPYTSLQNLLEEMTRGSMTLLLLDGIQDPQNLGGVIRTAYLFGVDGVVVTSHQGATVSGGCCKAASGATEYLPIARIANVSQALELLKERGFWVYGTDPEGEKELYEEDFPEKVAFVIGGEGKGMKALTRKRCDLLLRIPMKGEKGSGIDSLNATTSGAIVLYELLRQRAKKRVILHN